MQQEQARSAEEAYRAFCAGEPEAFGQLMEEFQQPLTGFLHGYVHSLETAENLAEETFVELLLHKERFRGQNSFKIFLFSVARHKAIGYIRREQRHPGFPSGKSIEYGESTIAGAIGRQPKEHQEVLRLLYLERLCYDEIAQVMRKKKKQVDNLAYRARKSLYGTLGED
ncbi:MAG: RNA polymerase sigma factor [Firmicutes bacterium]|nr:RNA polymerase sigma factor [Bacillota bacterium]